MILGRFMVWYDITLGPCVNLKSEEMATFQLKCNKLRVVNTGPRYMGLIYLITFLD